MKNITSKAAAVVLAMTLSFVSCKNNSNPTPATTTTTTTTTTTAANDPQNANNNGHTNTEVDNWIYTSMKSFYLWADFMPAVASTDLTRDPAGANSDGYFYSLLYKYGLTTTAGTIDHNSWIQNATDLSNELSGVNSAIYGFRSAYFAYPTGNNVAASVSYVIKGSAADLAGLKRGDIITKINGVQLTNTNYTTLISATNTNVFTLADFTSSNFVDNGKTITATKAAINEDPVAYSTVLSVGGKKVGYFLLSQFISNSTYTAEMRNIFANFKSQGVTELVVDLRLNGGGSVQIADILSSLIVKNPTSSTVLHKDQWSTAVMQNLNSTYSASSVSSFLTSTATTEASNLNLSRAFFLVSGGTASASELVINSLRPYMNVVLIGDKTYGKNVFSVSLLDNQDDSYAKFFGSTAAGTSKYSWGLQPIVGWTVNSAGNATYGVSVTNNVWTYQGGMTPDYAITDNVLPYKTWGDPTETLLSKVVSIISGGGTMNLRTDATQQANMMGESIIHHAENPSLENYNMFVSKKLTLK